MHFGKITERLADCNPYLGRKACGNGTCCCLKRTCQDLFHLRLIVKHEPDQMDTVVFGKHITEVRGKLTAKRGGEDIGIADIQSIDNSDRTCGDRLRILFREKIQQVIRDRS